MDISHRVLHIPQNLGLLLRQLPALTLGAVGAVVSAVATYQLWPSSVRNIGLKCAGGQVLKRFQHAVWLVSVEDIDTLNQRKGRKDCTKLLQGKQAPLTDTGMISLPFEMSSMNTNGCWRCHKYRVNTSCDATHWSCDTTQIMQCHTRVM